MIRAHTCTTLLVCALLGACTALPGREAARTEYIEAQKAQARALRRDDELAASLAIWRSLLPLGKPDRETARALAELERDIDSRVSVHRREGTAAYQRGDTRRGDMHMLKILALQPGHEEALNRLAATAAARTRARQQVGEEEADGSQYRVAPAAADSPSARLRDLYAQGEYNAMLALGATLDRPPQAAAAGLLRSAHEALAERAEGAGDRISALDHMQEAMALAPRRDDPLLERSLSLRRELSLHWYEEGSRLINTDLNGAIEALEKSLSFNPYNDRARRRLDQARTLQRNLQRIESSR